MHRHVSLLFLGFLAVGLLWSAPAAAGEDADLREEVRKLQEKVDALEAQNAGILEHEVDAYLESSADWREAQGDGPLSGVTINARFTAVAQATIGLDQNNRSVVNGVVDLEFNFQVNDNLNLFINLTANDGVGTFSGAFPAQFGPVGAFGPIAGPTVAGLTDGVGVNGTAPIDPGSITVADAGILYVMNVGKFKLHHEIGALDPRKRFLQNAFADNEQTQFIHNSFDDTAAVMWLTDTTGRMSYGYHGWMHFGADEQYTVSFGWFNIPGQWFNNGQLYFQFHWKGEIAGREMNLRALGFLDDFFKDATGDSGAGGGFSGDWWATEKIGVFVRLTVTGSDANPVELDGSVGAVFVGLIGSRPDDTLGVAVGIIQTNDTGLRSFTGNPAEFFPEDTEFTLEIYYRYMMEDGKLQITPHLIFVSDPGGGRSPWQDSDLFILGIRIHVPF